MQADVQQTVKPPNVDIYETTIQEMSKSAEESKKKADLLLEELHEKQKKEMEMQDEMEGLKDSLLSERQNLSGVISDRERLITICDEKDSALEAGLLDKNSLEAKLAKLSSQRNKGEFGNLDGGGTFVVKSNGSSDTQMLSKLKEDLKVRTEELHASEETVKTMLKEKKNIFEKSFEDERKTFKMRIVELERKLESATQALRAAEATFTMINVELHAMHDNMKELEELREMKEDIDRKKEQTATILKRQGEQLTELDKLYKEEQVMRKRYYNTIEDMKGKIRVYCRLRPLNEKEIVEKETNAVVSLDEFTVAHPWKEDKSKQHMYDRVFDEAASQDDVFEDTKYLIQSAVDGYNVCIFAYGQTRLGKTFTIYGSESNHGLTPRATLELFRVIATEHMEE